MFYLMYKLQNVNVPNINVLGCFPIKDMQTLFRNGLIFLKDAQYAETNEK